MLRLRRYLLPYRWRFIFMIVVATIGVGAATVVPLVTKAVIDGPIARGDQQGLIGFGLLAIGLGVIEAGLTFLRRWVVVKGTIGVESSIRQDLYAKLQQLPMSFHRGWESGQLLSRIMSDLSTVRRFLGFGMLFLIMNTLQIAVVCGLLLSMYWPLGLVVLASVVPIAVAVPAQRAPVHPALPRDPGPGRRRGLLGGGGRLRPPGDQGLRPGPARLQDLRRAEHPAVRHLDGAGPAQCPVLDLPPRSSPTSP